MQEEINKNKNLKGKKKKVFVGADVSWTTIES